MSTAMLNMYISFAGLLLMFISAGASLLARTKLSGILSKIVLTFSFCCMVVSGLIVLYIVVGGPTSTHE
ncbi:hypothetical protein JCM19046_4473 [Bacillus sp. JCM 19046]|uniref:DUF2768 domain-containing protein n=1 Tax=Shouchella xiaoxiensis TaxID=766895 RepID=A0ABS2SYN9_9BACI|nr:DUF2768 domain-containing protein [Shouchella xiaoxiensis]MBM7840146.1 hypothetical protein [Shouchella xiaoxiensis]GAF14344.1 hypothetical protein JCM19045_3656 [Bacillus sp. JCM 19045]GAF19794.1 hypothetical protein JCM19046_4473 [Bacillus sp. JCM 19046]